MSGNGGGQGQIGLIQYHNPTNCRNYDVCDFYFKNFRITDNTGTALHEVSGTIKSRTANKQTVDLRDVAPFDANFNTGSTFTISMEVWDFNPHYSSTPSYLYQTITGVQVSFSTVPYFTNYWYSRHYIDEDQEAYLIIGVKIISCDGHFTVPGCEQCAENWYPADSCTVHCVPDTVRYTCSDQGVKECREHYFGSDCTTHCEPDPERYDCSSEGVKECKEHYFGSDCTVHCEPDPRRYECSSDGLKECKEHYFGSDCTVRCVPDPERYDCSSQGVKECKEHYFCLLYTSPSPRD